MRSTTRLRNQHFFETKMSSHRLYFLYLLNTGVFRGLSHSKAMKILLSDNLFDLEFRDPGLEVS